MNTLRFRRLAPLLDAACLVLFVALGRERHQLDNTGVTWFLTVLWPLAVAWAAGALVSRLYTRTDHAWLRLASTVVVGVIVQGVLRAAFTNRVSFSIFTLVALGFLSLTTFGWRLVWLSVSRWRRTAPAR